MNRTTTIFTIAGVTVVSGLVAYALYFDYKRRNDVTFRKKLRKEKKKVSKQVAEQQAAAKAAFNVSEEELRAALLKIRAEEGPKDTEEAQVHFTANLNLGDQLITQGPEYHFAAALAYYKALRMYPQPIELIMVFQEKLPEPMFKMIMDMTSMDVRHRIEGYYESFPPKDLNVSVKPVSGADKKHLVAERDFEAGELIYKEEPVVTALDPDLLTSGTYCTHCLRHIQKGMAISAENDALNAVYCSKDCQVKSKHQSQNLLFGLDSVLPVDMDHGMSELTKPQRAKAEAEFANYIKSQTKSASLLTARVVARQIALETTKLVPNMPTVSHVAVPYSDGEYGLSDHLERLRYARDEIDSKETQLVCAVLASAIPGLESSLTQERHGQLLGKVAYSAIGVCYSGGRDDKPPSTERPENKESTRTPYGTSRQIGSGLYLVSSYIAHSCSPSARPSFSSGTAELNLIATRPIKKGDEITIAYVNVSPHADETPIETRRRRRIELARGWRFKCECTLCLEEAATVSTDDAELGVEKDESKVEEVVQRVENGLGPVPPDVE